MDKTLWTITLCAINKNLQKRATINKLKHMEKCNSSIKILDYRATFPELKHAIKKLKNKKSSYSDLIKNEMLKAYIKYWNIPEYLE